MHIYIYTVYVYIYIYVCVCTHQLSIQMKTHIYIYTHTPTSLMRHSVTIPSCCFVSSCPIMLSLSTFLSLMMLVHSPPMCLFVSIKWINYRPKSECFQQQTTYIYIFVNRWLILPKITHYNYTDLKMWLVPRS